MRNVLSLSQTSYLCEIGRTTVYDAAKREGEVLGVPVLKINRRMVVPMRPLAAALGMTVEEIEDALAAMPSRDTEPSGTAA